MYTLLDSFFIVFHSGFILFNLTGWAFPKTRPLHLFTTGLTLLSWFGLGVLFGWGYCPSTYWHWEVKRKLGEADLPASYVKYYLDHLTGLSWDPLAVDTCVVFLGLLAFVVSCWFNWRDHNSHRGT